MTKTDIIEASISAEMMTDITGPFGSCLLWRFNDDTEVVHVVDRSTV